MENVLKPGEIIRPQMNQDMAKDLLRRLYGLEADTCKEFNSYDDRNYYMTVKPESMNVNIPSVWSDGYVLKVTNSQDSKCPDFTDAQNMMILHMAKSLPVPEPVKNVMGQLKSVEQIGYGKHIVRLLKYVPGRILYELAVWSDQILYQCGSLAARMDLMLADFSHPAYQDRNSIWFLSSVPNLTQFISAVKDENRKALASEIINEFTQKVKPVENQLEAGIIHGDLNEQNILVKQQEGEDEYSIHTVLDFGDSQQSCLVYELAIVIMYMMAQCSCEPNKAGGYVIAGYLDHRDLPVKEKQLLRICVAARYAQSLVMGAYSYQQDPGNEYLLITTKNGWNLLEKFWKVPIDTLYRDWDEIISQFHTHNKDYLSSCLN